MRTVSMTLRYTKTVKLDIVLSDHCTIESAQVSGDFFVYPEESIEILERALRGCDSSICVENAFSNLDSAVVLGLDREDLKQRIIEVLEQCRVESQ